ncbi:MAG: biopolymer transporter ExbD, partial [Phycisphaerales bacterium]|nr:biopolymer transporter ExbD [Phycisphaerales bacterium]
TPDPLIINMTEDEILVEDQPVRRAELGVILRTRWNERPDVEVQIRASRTLPFSRIRPVLALCRDAGVEGVTIATEPAP